jgi:AraC-like DNA-binding protein
MQMNIIYDWQFTFPPICDVIFIIEKILCCRWTEGGIMKDIDQIQKLVGNVSAEDLKYVDCSVSENLGIFIPSVGFCKYAITPRHVHPSYMLNLFVAPEHCIVEQGTEIPENYYLAVALSPGIPHQENIEDDFKRYYAIMIEKGYFDDAYDSYTSTRPPELFWKQFLVGSEIMFYLKQFIFEYENWINNSEQVLQSLSLLITHKLIRSLLNIEDGEEPVSGVYQIEKTQQYIHQNFGNKLTVSSLAQTANMSVSHFMRVFKRETGLSPMEYLIKVRIEKAKKLLSNSDRNITEISLSCGFGSTSHFSSCFLKQTGQTPTEYRKIYRQNYKIK